VNLPENIQEKLLEYAIKKLGRLIKINALDFIKGYNSSALARNLQILGAFAYLTRQKNKTWFEPYIMPAVKSLEKNIINFKPELTKLKKLWNLIFNRLSEFS